jgi:hypothetical protein
MQEQAIIKEQIEKEAGITLSADWQNEFTAYINYLITNHFEKLIYLLYRIDVSEAKIKHLLETKTEGNAGELIANAIIERQMEKVASRKKYQQTNEVNEDEQW